jgi:hypothetical protein
MTPGSSVSHVTALTASGLDSKKLQPRTTSLKSGSDVFFDASFGIQEVSMMITCPSCGSLRTRPLHRGRKTGAGIGMAAGSMGGMAGALSGAESGALVGAWAGPLGLALGSLTGAVFGGLVGGTAGGITGARLGNELDARVLDNHECLACQHTFRSTP